MAITCHEIGHALGYTGHSSSAALMQKYYHNITSYSPNAYEKAHLSNVH